MLQDISNEQHILTLIKALSTDGTTITDACVIGDRDADTTLDLMFDFGGLKHIVLVDAIANQDKAVADDGGRIEYSEIDDLGVPMIETNDDPGIIHFDDYSGFGPGTIESLSQLQDVDFDIFA